MAEKEYSRRGFIRRCTGHGTVVLGMTFLLNSCGSSNEQAVGQEDTGKAVADPCNDLSSVSAEELDKRERMAYIDKSQMPDSSCENCGLYIPWENQPNCGGCLLFKGPVHAAGYCIQWVAKTTG